MTLHPDIERVALLGWHLYPQTPAGRSACVKQPTDRATCDLNQLARWTREFPGCGWRVVCGPSRIWALDCDRPPGHAHDGVAALADLVRVHGPLPAGPRMRSGGGGVAVFFRHDAERIIGDGGYPAPGIDPRRGRQSQTIPPTLHHTTRKPYRWLAAPWEVAAPKAPAWLLRLVEQPAPVVRPVAAPTTDTARGRLYRAALAVMDAGQGERNGTLNRRAYQVGRMIGAGVLGEQEAADALYAAAVKAGLDHAEIRATLKSGFTSGMRAALHVGR